MSLNVILADDHILIREGIKQLLEFDGSIKVIDEAGDGIECITKCKNEKPDILLLDINMPNKNGIDTLVDLKKEKLPVKVLMLTVHNEIEYLIRAIDIGVDGYILKDSGSTELKEAIQTIMKGDSYIQPKLLPALNNYLIRKDIDKDKLHLLTKREKQVLIQVASGKFNKDIAKNLDISERTVKNHMSSIFKKIEVNDRTQAAVFAIKNNLISLH